MVKDNLLPRLSIANFHQTDVAKYFIFYLSQKALESH